MNMREALSNIDAATANAADGTEALTHNFLVRGFLMHRSYFNLAHLSSDPYRKDRLFTSAKNARAWLPAVSVFEKDSHGDEQLTSDGKHLLDSAVTHRRDSIVEGAIVIEGYASGVNPAEQLAFSRSRAILVRHSLEVHFMLDASHIGIVTMKDLPSSGLEHATWDGACVVIASPKT